MTNYIILEKLLLAIIIDGVKVMIKDNNYIDDSYICIGKILNYEDLFMIHSTIKTVTHNLDEMKFNTALSRLMEFVNYFYSKGLNHDIKLIYMQLLAPFAPHLCEELWSKYNEESVFLSSWPSFNDKYLERDNIKIAVQVNGKLRATLDASKDIDKTELIDECKKHPNVVKFILDKEIIREIYVPGKIVNIVIK